MIYELSISTDYRPEWGVWEGLRELIQNMYDAAGETGGDATHWHDGRDGHFACLAGRLEVTDLLLGETSKADDPGMIGQFGDGLKIGALALLRKGHKVTMTQRGERWHFSLRESARYRGRRTMHVDVRKHGREVPDGTRFTVGDLPVGDYNQALSRFLPEDRMSSSILMDRAPGDIYVKGVYVTNMEDYAFAYNLPNLRVGPDRSLLDSTNLESEIFWTIRGAITNGELPHDDALRFLEGGTGDADLPEYFGSTLGSDFYEYMRSVRDERYGIDAYPAVFEDETRKLMFNGHRVFHPGTKFLARAYWEALGTSFAELMEGAKFRGDAVEELREEERDVLTEAAGLTDLDPGVIDVREYADERVNGHFDRDTRRISVARRLLASLPETLATLVHEKAHRETGETDGTPGFQTGIRRCTVGLLERLLRAT